MKSQTFVVVMCTDCIVRCKSNTSIICSFPIWLKLYVLSRSCWSYVPLMHKIISLQGNFNENTYIVYYAVQHWNVGVTSEFYICYTIILLLFRSFKYLQSRGKLYSILFLFPLISHGTGTRFPSRKKAKHIILESNQEYENSLWK